MSDVVCKYNQREAQPGNGKEMFLSVQVSRTSAFQQKLESSIRFDLSVCISVLTNTVGEGVRNV